MSWQFGEVALLLLTTVPSIHKQSHRPPQRPKFAAETPAPAAQPCQVVTQFGVVCFHRIGLALVQNRRKLARIHKLGISGKTVGEIVASRRGLIHHRLQTVPITLIDHPEGTDAAGVSVYAGQEIGGLFF